MTCGLPGTPSCHPERSEGSGSRAVDPYLSYARALSYAVYILAGRSRVLYVGVTNDLERRIIEHKEHRAEGFTDKYKLDRLVYFEQTPDVKSGIAREKQLKGWRRDKKVALIESVTPTWNDLSLEWPAVRDRTRGKP